MKKLLLFFFFLNAIGMEAPKVEIKIAGLWDRAWFRLFGGSMQNEYVENKHTGQLYKVLTVSYCINHYKRAKKSQKLDKVESLQLHHDHITFLRPIQDEAYTHEKKEIFFYKAPNYVLKSEDGSLHLDFIKLKGYDPDQMEDIFSRHFSAQTINATRPVKPILKIEMLIDQVSVEEIEE